MTGDVALLKLNASATLNEFVDIMGINTDEDCPVTGQTCTAYGWGQESEGWQYFRSFGIRHNDYRVKTKM